jgi:hypothetical protein
LYDASLSMLDWLLNEIPSRCSITENICRRLWTLAASREHWAALLRARR